MTIRRLGNPEGEVVSLTCEQCQKRVTSVAQLASLPGPLTALALADVRSDPHYLEPQTTAPEMGEQLVVAHDKLLPWHAITLYRHHPDQDVFGD